MGFELRREPLNETSISPLRMELVILVSALYSVQTVALTSLSNELATLIRGPYFQYWHSRN